MPDVYTACENINQPMFMIKAGRAKKNIVIDTGNADTKLYIKIIVISNAIICMPRITVGAYLITRFSGVFICGVISTCVMVYGWYEGI